MCIGATLNSFGKVTEVQEKVKSFSDYDLLEKVKLVTKAVEMGLTSKEALAESVSEKKRHREKIIAEFAILWLEELLTEEKNSDVETCNNAMRKVADVIFVTSTKVEEVNLKRIFNQIIEKYDTKLNWSFGVFADIPVLHSLMVGTDNQFAQIDSVISDNFEYLLNNAGAYDVPILIYGMGSKVRNEFWREKLYAFLSRGAFSKIQNPQVTLEKYVLDVCSDFVKEVYDGILNTTLNGDIKYYPLEKILQKMADVQKYRMVSFEIKPKVYDIILNAMMLQDGNALNHIMENLIEDFGCDDIAEGQIRASAHLNDIAEGFVSMTSQQQSTEMNTLVKPFLTNKAFFEATLSKKS